MNFTNHILAAFAQYDRQQHRVFQLICVSMILLLILAPRHVVIWSLLIVCAVSVSAACAAAVAMALDRSFFWGAVVTTTLVCATVSMALLSMLPGWMAAIMLLVSALLTMLIVWAQKMPSQSNLHQVTPCNPA